MQQIMTHTTQKCIYLQSAEIFNNAQVSIRNLDGTKVMTQQIINTNYLCIDTKLPDGEYIVIVEENGQQWKRNIFLRNEIK